MTERTETRQRLTGGSQEVSAAGGATTPTLTQGDPPRVPGRRPGASHVTENSTMERVATAEGEPPIVEFALWYARNGWRVLPLHHVTGGRCSCGNPRQDPNHDYRQGGKHPVHKAWQDTATTDETVIAAWWTERPAANIGIATGSASGIFVLDVDPDNGGYDSLTALEAEHGPLPETWRDETGSGGLHFFFKWPGFNPKNSAGMLGPGLDIRADGGQVVAPPSVSVKGPYTLRDGIDPAEAPGWLVDMLRPPAPRVPSPAGAFVAPVGNQDAYTQKAVQAECDAITAAVDGEQNDTINRAAFSVGTLVGAGALTEGEARDTLVTAARAGNHPEGRALATIGSGLRAGMAQPRHPWPPVARPDLWTSRNDFSSLTPETRPTNPRKPSESQRMDADRSSGLSGTPITDTGWDRPLSVDAPALAPFPVDVLGGLGEFVTATAASLQVPVDLVAFAALATISTATGGRREIQVKADWRESTALYLAALADSSEKKTPALNAAANPLRAIEEELMDAARPEVEATAQEIRITTARMGKAEQNAANATPDKRRDAEADAEAARVKLLELGDTPELPRLLVRDITLEALAKRMYEQGGRIGSLASEGGLFKVAAGLYGNNGKANTDLLLEAYTGGPYTIDRTGRAGARMSHTFLALGLIVQPGIISGLEKQNPEFRQSGLLGRFLYAKPGPTEEDTFDSPPVPAEVASAYDHRIRDLIKRVWSTPDVLTIELSTPARQAFGEFYNAFAKRRKPGGDLHDLADWAGKLRGQLIRIAACLTLYEDPGAREIGHQRMVDVISMAPYFIAHARAVFDLMGKNREGALKPLRDVLAWLRGRKDPGADFSARDVWQALKGREWAEDMDAMNDVLLQLENYGWIALIPPPDTTGKRGRKPSPQFAVHPDVASHKTQNGAS